MIIDWSIGPPSGLVRWTPIEQGLPEAHELWASTHASESAWLTQKPVSFHSTRGSICRDQIGAGRWPPMWDSQSLTSVGTQHTPRYGYLCELIGCGSRRPSHLTHWPTTHTRRDRWSDCLSGGGPVAHWGTHSVELPLGCHPTSRASWPGG